ncbi:MAG: histidine kinase, partial [Bacteroidota bacterium]
MTVHERVYFTFSYATIIREVLWIVINLSLAVAICFAKEALDEKDMLTALQKDATFYKLRYLRAQLNPHFLFNTLNSIYSLSLQKSD